MSSRSEFEEFARDCVRLAGQANSPELRQKLFDIAREWMRAAIDWEDARKTTPRSRGYEASEKVKSSEYAPRAFEAEQVTIRISVHAKSQNQDHHYWHARAVKVARGRSRKSRLALRVSARASSVRVQPVFMPMYASLPH